ncbi:MAG: hypothetical protein IPK70_06640 [Flavobacteriales bacterium]|nr:hypothetical protein [Flavobacteriales bacterium]
MSFTKQAWRTCVPAALLAGAFFHSDRVNCQSLVEHWWHTDGEVRSIIVDEPTNRVFIGGNFTHVSPPTPHSALIDAVTAEPSLGHDHPDERVEAVIPDGNGGWFIAGYFNWVGSQARRGVARMNSDGSVHPFDAGTNGFVRTMALVGNTLYIGGNFTQVSGQARTLIAAVDATTGSLLPWDPNITGPATTRTVRTIVHSNGVLYVGGVISTVGGQTRTNIAAIDATTGSPTSWAPEANGQVITIAVNSGVIYAGGTFTQIGGQTRNRIAALSESGIGVATTWNPNANSFVECMAVHAGTLLVGGEFNTIGGQSRFRLAQLNLSDGQATSWNPGITGSEVNALSISGSTVYVGGDFSTAGGAPRRFLAQLDLNSNTALAWDPKAYGTVLALGNQDGKVFAGGSFTGIGGVDRTHLAALDLTTGAATSWNPNVVISAAADGINAMVKHGNTLYLTGNFNSINGTNRENVAALSLPAGTVTSWNPDLGGDQFVVYRGNALAVGDGVVYIGGDFTEAGGQLRSNIAAVNTTNGAALAWNPGADAPIRSIALTESGDSVFVSGDFDTIGGQARSYLALLSASDGQVLPWDPQPDNGVSDLTTVGNSLYVGGSFNNIASTARNRLARFDLTTGGLDSWDPSVTGFINVVEQMGDTVFVGGSFSSIGGQEIYGAGLIDADSGVPFDWDPGTGGVKAIAQHGCEIMIGGTIDGTYQNPRFGFAVLCGAAPNSTDEGMLSRGLLARPNPASSHFEIPLPAGMHVKQCNLLDASGRNMKVSANVLSDRVEIDRGSLASGVYLVHLELMDGSDQVVRIALD